MEIIGKNTVQIRDDDWHSHNWTTYCKEVELTVDITLAKLPMKWCTRLYLRHATGSNYTVIQWVLKIVTQAKLGLVQVEGLNRAAVYKDRNHAAGQC